MAGMTRSVRPTAAREGSLPWARTGLQSAHEAEVRPCMRAGARAMAAYPAAARHCTAPAMRQRSTPSAPQRSARKRFATL